MHHGTITWNGSDLSRIGKPKLGIRRQPDPPPPAVASRMLVTLTVTIDLEALDPATILARAQWLADSMRVAEGMLVVTSGTNSGLSWMAAPADTNLNEVLAGRSNVVELGFLASENHPDSALSGLPECQFTPAGSSTAMNLHRVREVKEDIRTTRHAERNGARNATTTTLSFTARLAMSNPAEPLASRLAYLRSQAEAVKSLDTREGLLRLGSLSRIVRVTEFSPLIDERAGTLDVSVQCYSVTLPDSGRAEGVMEMDTRLDEGSGEEVISLSGTLDAETEAIALAKLEIIRAGQQVAGQRVVSYTKKQRVIDGADTTEENGGWTGSLNWTMEVRKARAGGHLTLRIATQKDYKAGMRWNYSGSVTAADALTALTTARQILADSTHPVVVRSDETFDTASRMNEPEQFDLVKLDFSYEFEGPSDGFISGEITTDTSRPLAGEWLRTTSGYLIAITQAAAEARLTTLLAGETHKLQVTRRWSETYLDETGSDAAPRRVVSRLDFSCGIRESRLQATAEYTDTTENDYTTMRQSREISGTLWTDTKAHAETCVADFLAALLGTRITGTLPNGDPVIEPVRPQRLRVSHAELQWAPASAATVGTGIGGLNHWIKLDFSCTSAKALTGVVGYDLLEASYTMERIGGINTAVVTPIPFGRAMVQTGIGWIPGKIGIQASAKAVNLATAKSWVQGKRSLAPAATDRAETDQPRETQSPEYLPLSGTEVALWNFSGSYGWTYAVGLDGIW